MLAELENMYRMFDTPKDELLFVVYFDARPRLL